MSQKQVFFIISGSILLSYAFFATPDSVDAYKNFGLNVFLAGIVGWFLFLAGPMTWQPTSQREKAIRYVLIVVAFCIPIIRIVISTIQETT